MQLVDCEVKQSRYGDGFEVVLKSASEIQESAKLLDVHNVLFDNEISFARNSAEITLQMLPDLELFQNVLVSVNAIIVNKTLSCGNW